jgi:hypothetical protein
MQEHSGSWSCTAFHQRSLVCWHDKRQHSTDSRKTILRRVGRLPSHVYILPPLFLPSPPHQSLGVCLTERTGPCVNCARRSNTQPAQLICATGVSSKFANSVQTFVGLYSRQAPGLSLSTMYTLLCSDRWLRGSSAVCSPRYFVQLKPANWA